MHEALGITEFFRHCPDCGQRFHVKLEGKKLISANREEFSPTPTRGGLGRSAIGVPVLIDIDEYQYNYKCQACGHEWSEKRIIDEPESSGV